ncbi:uncharacterized protein LOC110728665 [Chenopodium quinoa]|uniref:uncharacterized protein LOC110728665 n=1 Tax=Chenopodium quinoa TaxID=63459 RepID=UPI000B79435A|nr:uncharacterized protein LOC110728665 [Chenopodium quinoa]
MYEEVKFGKIVLRSWMIFIDKAYLRETLKDYAVPKGFTITVVAADSKRYTVTCLAQCCEWRLHASRLPDGKTWAIKKIWPDKQATLYRLKRYVVQEIFGGHYESYNHLPRYAEVIMSTNPGSKAFVAWHESETIPRVNLFSSIFISFAGQWQGFLAGCRPLIGVDGAHFKGNYGGILLSDVVLDGNNEIYPVAYAVGVDVALKTVWPEAKRRYCCRHLSRNYKKAFPGPLMYTLFWRACNATNKFTFRKAMERLQKEGGEDVMTWFAALGHQSKWSKHRFDPNVCNDSNTSNFVESFNSTRGPDRCRPVLTLLEGIRRVCMVRIASRHEAAMDLNNDELCPKIARLVREISKASTTCRAFQSSPGEYEIHEGKSQFPLSLNSKICSCGAWQLSGIPCRHAIRAMTHAKVDPHNYVSSWYSAQTYKKVYSHCITPIPDLS